jgi:Asp-tRNA(Asn)/Glu-tRNA(Gln) amidotransferase A subunit family amidase
LVPLALGSDPPSQAVARTVDDLAVAYDAMQGPDGEDPHLALRVARQLEREGVSAAPLAPNPR